MRKLIYIFLLLPFFAIGQKEETSKLAFDLSGCCDKGLSCSDINIDSQNSSLNVINNPDCTWDLTIDCAFVQDDCIEPWIEDNIDKYIPAVLLDIAECTGPFTKKGARDGWWGTWSDPYTANTGTIIEDWVEVRSVTSPECITDASIDFDMGFTYYQLRRMRMYFWLDWRVLINGAQVFQETFDVYHYKSGRTDTNPDVINPLDPLTADNGYADAVRLNVPANATITIETRQRYNFNGAQASAYGRVISGLRSDPKVDFFLRNQITDVTVQSTDKYWILEEYQAYSSGLGQAPEDAKLFDSEKELLAYSEKLDEQIIKEVIKFNDDAIKEAEKFAGETVKDEKEKSNNGQIKKQSTQIYTNKDQTKGSKVFLFILGLIALILFGKYIIDKKYS